MAPVAQCPPGVATTSFPSKDAFLVPKHVKCTLLRGGSSRAPILSLSSILSLYPKYTPSASRTTSPLADPNLHSILIRILPQILGTGNPLQVDGVGGGNSVTSKAAVVCPSLEDGVDVDYLFAQVSILGEAPECIVDFGSNCGNVMAAVGVYAYENNMSSASPSATSNERTVAVRNINTNSISILHLVPPLSRMPFSPDSPLFRGPNEYNVRLDFPDIHGPKTGKLLPTLLPSQLILGKQVSLVDAATVVVFLLASEFGLDTSAGWDVKNKDVLGSRKSEIESIRREAGWLMGLGDVSNSVLPKVCFVSRGSEQQDGTDGTLAQRSTRGPCDISLLYLTPHAPHATIAVTGALCTLVASCTPGTLPNKCVTSSGTDIFRVGHPGGVLELEMIRRKSDGVVLGGRLKRTARVIFQGTASVWVEE